MLAIESEAADAYEVLADQMDTHNNPAIAAVFRELATIEMQHVQDAAAHAVAAGFAIDSLPHLAFHVDRGESPPLDESHYLMTPHHALSLALRGEENAVALFTELERSAPTAAVRNLAAAARLQEQQHVERVRAWLAEQAAPAADWAHDPDPPSQPE